MVSDRVVFLGGRGGGTGGVSGSGGANRSGDTSGMGPGGIDGEEDEVSHPDREASAGPSQSRTGDDIPF